MAELVIIFLLYLIAAAAGGESEFTLFLVFACIIGLAWRRIALNRKAEARWHELQQRLGTLEASQVQLRKLWQEMKAPPTAEGEPAQAAPKPAGESVPAATTATPATPKAPGVSP